jgi:dTDP-4-dehydrorhamnose reductase
LKILLFGKNGQVGWELQRALAPLGELVALDREDSDPLSGDLGDAQRLAATIRAVRPDVVVNAAAHTAVDKAESEPELARALNATAPCVMAREAAALGAWLVHYSTDYVFDGSGSLARDEDAATGPLNVYGTTKLEGEQLVRAAGGRHLIFRTSWVYASRGHNFARTMLRLAAERDRLSIIDDQHGAPTGADLLADVTAHALRQVVGRPDVGGTYHLVAAGETTWWGYARHVIAAARAAGQPIRVADEGIQPVPTSAFPTPAQRPLNSRLSTRKLRDTFGLALPDWQTGVDRMLAEVLGR